MIFIGKILHQSEHNHVIGGSVIKAKKVVTNAKKRARTTNESAQHIVTDSSLHVSDQTAKHLPTMQGMIRMVNGVRKQENPLPPLPTSADDLQITGEFLKTFGNANFVKFDGLMNKRRVIILTTDKNLKFLGRCPIWFNDGTFDVVPRVFYQLYTIHGIKNNVNMPLVYVLMTDKSEKTFIEVFSFLKKNLVKRPKVRSARFDFEKAPLNAFKFVFPDVEVKGCLFHLGQAIYRNVQAKGLQTMYQNDEACEEFVKMVIALAYVPVEDVKYAFNQLKKEQFYRDNKAKLSPLLDYVKNTWFGDIELWNHYDTVLTGDPRTNNVCESWHAVFGRRVGASHLTIYKFLNELKKEQQRTEIKMSQNEAGEEPPTKRRKYRSRESRIFKLVSEYDRDDVISYLRGLSPSIVISA